MRNTSHIRLWEAAQDDPLGDEDAIENLMSLLRRYIRAAGFEDQHVSYDGEAISVQFVLGTVETMQSLMRVMDLLHKLHSDILIEYECEFDVAETTKDQPLLTAVFYYQDPGGNSDYYSDEPPF